MIAMRLHADAIGAVTADEVEAPVPGDGEVLVRLEASTINPADLKIRDGRITPRGGASPWTLGWDLVGHVAAGALPSGTRVIGMSTMASTGLGTWSELVALPADAVTTLDAELDAATLAQLPLTGLTALQAVQDLDARPRDAVTVFGARGAVGRLVVQLLRHRGIDPVEHVRGDPVVPSSADGIVDAAGADFAIALRPGGRYVAVVPGTEPTLAEGSALVTVRVAQSGKRLAGLLDLLREGVLTLGQPHVHSLVDTQAAFETFQRRDGRRVALVTGISA